MKKLLTYITVFLTLTACTSEEALDNEQVKGIVVEIVDPKGVGDGEPTRSSLAYDDATDVMVFSWHDADAIGVFTYPDAEHSSQQKFTQVPNDPENTSHLRVFKTPDDKLTLQQRCQYVSCFPYFEGHTMNYTNIPVDYTGQRQAKPVDFSYYWYDKNDEAYKESQPEASAHLSKYDFLCTGPTDPTPNLGIHFKLNRMGIIVRFWIVIDPNNNYVYDELQLVNRTKMFTTKATMDAAECTLTPTEQSHMVNLQLGAVGEGFDMTNKDNNGTRSKTPFYHWSKTSGNYTGYIMAYMMLAPVDLSAAETENSFIYLVAHESGHTENKHYFKSSGLSKPNLTPNMFYKWTPTLGDDTPIAVSEITVEEWREGTTFDNNGTGTGSW